MRPESGEHQLPLLVLPVGVNSTDVWLYTIDAHLPYRGFSILVDYYWRNINQFTDGSVLSLFDEGFVVQTGYFVIPHETEDA